MLGLIASEFRAPVTSPSGAWSRSGTHSCACWVGVEQLVVVMRKQACKLLALSSARAFGLSSLRGVEHSFAAPQAVLLLPLQPSSALPLPTGPGLVRCLHQSAGQQQVDLNYR